MQLKLIEDGAQVFEFDLLQEHILIKTSTAGTLHAEDTELVVHLSDKQQIEHFNFTQMTIVSLFVLLSLLILDFAFECVLNVVDGVLTVGEGSDQDSWNLSD